MDTERTDRTRAWVLFVAGACSMALGLVMRWPEALFVSPCVMAFATAFLASSGRRMDGRRRTGLWIVTGVLAAIPIGAVLFVIWFLIRFARDWQF